MQDDLVTKNGIGQSKPPQIGVGIANAQYYIGLGSPIDARRKAYGILNTVSCLYPPGRKGPNIVFRAPAVMREAG
jgi:hypothetical protein